MKTKMWEVLVPVADNRKHRYSQRKHNLWDKTVRAACGGLTKMPVVSGQWLDGDKLSTAPAMRKLADFTAKHYKQLAVLYYEISGNVNFHVSKG